MRHSKPLFILFTSSLLLSACGLFERRGSDDDNNTPAPVEEMGTNSPDMGAPGMDMDEMIDMPSTEADMATPEPDMDTTSEQEDLLEECKGDAREDRCDADPATYLEWGEFFAPSTMDLLEPGCCLDINEDGTEDNFYAELIEALGGVGGPDRTEYNAIIADDASDLEAQLLYELRPVPDAPEQIFMTSHIGVRSENGSGLEATSFVVGAYRPTNSASFSIADGGEVSFDGGALDVRVRMLGVPFTVPLQILALDGNIQRGMAQPSTMDVRVSGYVKLEDIFDGLNKALPEYCGCVEGIGQRSISWPGNNLSEAMCSIQDEDLGTCERGNEQDRYCAQRLTFCTTFAGLAAAGADIGSRRPSELCSEDGVICDSVSMSFDIEATAVSFQGVQ